MNMEVLSLCERGVKLGEKLGASEVEAYGILDSIREVDFKEKIESTKAAVFAGLGIRLTLDKRLGFYSSSQLTERGVERAVKGALAVAKVAQPDRDWTSFPTTYGKATVANIYDRNIESVTAGTLSEKAVDVMDGVHGFDKRTTITRGSIRVSKKLVAISNSHHCELQRESTYASAGLTITAEESGKKGQSSESWQRRAWQEIAGLELFRKASERSLEMMDAKPIESGRTSVVWRNDVFADILGIMFGRTLSADAIQKKRSPWTGKIGETMASENVNVLDEGIKDAGIGTREFDDEGYPQQNTPLITRGVLTNYIYDNYTANKEGKTSTGNASRSYRSIPTPSVNNLTLKPGKFKLEELIRDTKRGLYIHDVIGGWLSNPISGNLSATVTNGYLIENGELTQAVKGVIVSANFFTLIQDEASLIADDIENSGSTYAPSVKMQNINIIGT
jgi:PmbA protein